MTGPVVGFGADDHIVHRLRMDVADDLAAAGGTGLDIDDRRELARHLVVDRLRHRVLDDLASGRPAAGPDDERRIVGAVLDALFGLGRLQSLIDDPAVENIDVNGADAVWVTYADGSKVQAEPIAGSDEELIELVRSAAARLGMSERRFDVAQPELDLRLPDGSRLSALMSVTRRPALSIRRHRYLDLGLWDLVRLGTLGDGLASFLAAAVRARKNIVVGGAMNSGKTTMLRALAAEIPERERIVTIEQAFELGFDSSGRHPDLVALEARLPNTEGEGAFPMSRLVRRALRMNADRVIVGEVLGDEVIPMLNAMSQGRAGSMCTIHANSSHGVFRRIASYAVQAPERLPLEGTNLLVAGAIDLVVYLDMAVGPRHLSSGWSGQSGPVSSSGGAPAGAGQVAGRSAAMPRRRFVSSVLEVVDADGLHVVSNEVFRPGPDGRAVTGAPLRSATLEELVAHGFDPASCRTQPGRMP
ncbi:MAG: ATPase, T2SS/T4P/T4SS family [Actinomycetota bacterium]|nr:ATPase, T2SS/T4P/T4SS family [Actinomycetota bacterium]